MVEFLVGIGWILIFVSVIAMILDMLAIPFTAMSGLAKNGLQGAGEAVQSGFQISGQLLLVGILLANARDTFIQLIMALIGGSYAIYWFFRWQDGHKTTTTTVVPVPVVTEFDRLVVDPEFVRLAILFANYRGPLWNQNDQHPAYRLWLDMASNRDLPTVRAVMFLRERAKLPPVATAQGDWNKMYAKHAVSNLKTA